MSLTCYNYPSLKQVLWRNLKRNKPFKLSFSIVNIKRDDVFPGSNSLTYNYCLQTPVMFNNS